MRAFPVPFPVALFFGFAVAVGEARAGESPPVLGAELKLGAFSLRPPAGFRLLPAAWYQGSLAGAPAESRAHERALVAALSDGEGTDAASLWISRVEGPFSATPTRREAFAASVVHHFAEELHLRLLLERSAVVEGPGEGRLEVLGTVRAEGQVRRVLAAAFPGESRHAVVMFSAPPERFAALAPAVAASLDTLRLEGHAAAPRRSRGLLSAVAVVLLAALGVSVRVWTRLRAASSKGR